MKNKEMLLGSFILGALIIFIVGIFSVKNISLFEQGYTLRVIFNFGDGLKPASPVMVSGITAGEVKKISFINEGGDIKIIVYAWVKNGVRIPQGSEAFVNNLGLLGEKYLEIMPKKGTAEYLRDGDIIIGNNSTPLYEISQSFRGAIQKFSSLMDSIEDITEDKEMLKSLKSSISNLEEVSSESGRILKDLKDKKGTLGKLIYDDSIHQGLEDLIGDLKEHPWKLFYMPKGRR